MFRLDEGLKVYLHRAPIDFRLNINGLALLVEQSLGLDPFGASVYVFGNQCNTEHQIADHDGSITTNKRGALARDTGSPAASGRTARLNNGAGREPALCLFTQTCEPPNVWDERRATANEA